MAKSNQHLPPTGEMVDIGGRRLHAVIAGEVRDKLPVVLEAGLTATSSCWAWVQPELAKTTKVLAYDRAGLGWSEPTREPKDAHHIAEDLHRLLDATKFPKPFVFAGHSMGGMFGRAYAAMYPTDLAGMAFIDASHPEQIERSPNIRKALRRFFWFLKATPYMASCGVMKICGDFGLSAQSAGLPDVHTHATKKFFSSSQHLRETVREAEQWFTSAGQVKEVRLGDLPLLTITAPEKSMQGWMELQKELSEISARGRQVVMSGASHTTILTNKDFATRVADQVRTLL